MLHNEDSFTMTDNNAMYIIHSHTEGMHTANAMALYWMIKNYYNHKTGDSFPSITQLANDLHWDRKKVQLYKKMLIELKVLKYEKGGKHKSNRYTFPYEKETRRIVFPKDEF